MTIGELIQRLGEYRDEFGEDAEVRLMTQENWPFENSICGLVSGSELNGHTEDPDDEDVADDALVYIVEGGQLRYGSRRAWEICNG